MNSQFNVISLFSGCGGSSLGYQMANGKIVLAVEWNENAVNTYKLNFPGTPVYHGDIHDLSVDEILSQTGLSVGELDILDGSPPCQGFSTAGKRKFCDPRNELYNEYIRILRGLKPKVFVMENVPGMVKGKMKLIFADIMRKLKQSGYQVKARLMNAMYYGVPQSRRRVIFLGVRDDLGIIPSYPVPQTKPIPLYKAIGDLNNIQNPEIDHIWVDESPSGRNTKGWHLAKDAKQGEIYRFYRRRDYWYRPSPTLTTGGGSLNIPTMIGNSACHPFYTRAYSVLEYKRICSFPDDFKFAGVWYDAYVRMGNSVPPLLMKAIAEHIRDKILSEGEQP